MAGRREKGVVSRVCARPAIAEGAGRWEYDHGKLSEGVPLVASFAAASARPLPAMPECPGFQPACRVETERRREVVASRMSRSIGTTCE